MSGRGRAITTSTHKMATDGQTGKIVRRNRPGTKTEDFYGWPEQDYNDMDTTLAG